MGSFLPLLPVLALFAFSLLGCESPSSVPSGPFIPPPTADVSRLQAWRDAETVASLAPNRFVVVGSGASMRPVYGESTILVLEKVPFDSLSPDLNIAYMNRHGRIIFHRLLSRDARGWRIAGLNNPAEDPERVTAHNLLGVVYAAFANEDVN